MKLHAILTAFALMPLTMAATAASSRSDDITGRGMETTRGYQVQIVGTATSHACDASHTFQQSVSVCGQDGCRTLDIANHSEVAFRAPDGRIAIATSTTYTDGGVIYGDSELEEFQTGQQGQFVHTVTGRSGCLRSVVYRLMPAE